MSEGTSQFRDPYASSSAISEQNHNSMDVGTYRLTLRSLYKPNYSKDEHMTTMASTYYNVTPEALDELKRYLETHFEQFPAIHRE